MDDLDKPPSEDVEKDALIPPPDHPIRLPVFEGPLDLLLYLIRKNEIDIHDIPVGVVTRQYLEVLRSYEKMDLDVAGEFFVMAATLMVIKSRMLLPPEKIAAEGDDADEIDEDDNLDPRWQLVRQLIQYKRIKESAGHILALVEERQGFVQRLVPPPVEDANDRPVASGDRIEIWNTFNNILRRLSENARPGEIHAETVNITTRMEDILARLGRERSFTFTSLLPERPTIPLLVATFLACLELARLGKIILAQTGNFDDILCEERPADDPLNLDAEPPGETDHPHGGDPDDAFAEGESDTHDAPVDEDDFGEEDEEPGETAAVENSEAEDTGDSDDEEFDEDDLDDEDLEEIEEDNSEEKPGA